MNLYIGICVAILIAIKIITTFINISNILFLVKLRGFSVKVI